MAAATPHARKLLKFCTQTAYRRDTANATAAIIFSNGVLRLTAYPLS